MRNCEVCLIAPSTIHAEMHYGEHAICIGCLRKAIKQFIEGDEK